MLRKYLYIFYGVGHISLRLFRAFALNDYTRSTHFQCVQGKLRNVSFAVVEELNHASFNWHLVLYSLSGNQQF